MSLSENIRRAKELAKSAPPVPRVVAGVRRSLPCVHLGEPTGAKVVCGTCARGTNHKVFACSLHGACTVPASTLTNCATCADYRAATPPQHPNIAAATEFANAIAPYPVGAYRGRGVVIVGGGKYWPSTYVTVRMLRHVGCRLPVQVWYLGASERDDRYAALLAPFDCEAIDATAHAAASTVRSLTGFPGHPPFEAKSFAVLHAPFEEVLFLDADNYPCADPTVIFDEPRYRSTGGVYWPDMPHTNAWTKWPQWGVEKFGPDCGFEVGQFVINKSIAWRQLQMTRWYDDHGDWCYGWGRTHDHGDKGPHRCSWARFRTEPTFYATRSVWKSIAFLQPGPDGVTPMAVHRCRSKLVLSDEKFASTPQNGTNLRAGLPLESEAFGYLEELRRTL